eukprot:SAG31_NODE_89_length_26711_cov_24.949459_10_plen_137_part_00
MYGGTWNFDDLAFSDEVGWRHRPRRRYLKLVVGSCTSSRPTMRPGIYFLKYRSPAKGNTTCTCTVYMYSVHVQLLYVPLPHRSSVPEPRWYRYPGTVEYYLLTHRYTSQSLRALRSCVRPRRSIAAAHRLALPYAS